MSTIDRKVTFKTWLWQCVNDLKRLKPYVCSRGLVYTVSGDPRAGLPPMLARLYVHEALTMYYPLEVLCAYRCPFDPGTHKGEDEVISLIPSDRQEWLNWTAQAATGLFAYESWVRCLHHLLNPVVGNHTKNAQRYATLAGEVWAALRGVDGGSPVVNWREWLNVKSALEWKHASEPNLRLWGTDINEAQLEPW